MSANAIERDFADTVNGSWNRTFSPTLLNEFRAQFSREDRPRDYAGPSIPGQSRPLPDTGVSFDGYRFGLPFFIPVKDHDTRFQINDNVFIIKGAHNFKLGFELSRTSTTQTFIGFANGRFIFDSVQGFMNYMNIGPTSSSARTARPTTTAPAPRVLRLRGRCSCSCSSPA